MKKTDIAMIILIASISVVVAFFCGEQHSILANAAAWHQGRDGREALGYD